MTYESLLDEKVETKVDQLSNHTWLRIGGTAEIATPKSKEEAIELLSCCKENNIPYRILGAGSNLLVDTNGITDLIIDMKKCCQSIEVDGTSVTAGASVKLPQLANYIIRHDLGGIEYLYSVPGTVGGGVFMNAGRGMGHNSTLSDYLVSVEFFNGKEIETQPREYFDFSNRYSSFQDHNDWVILSATFEFPEENEEDSTQKIKDRMLKTKSRERSLPNAGSVFKTGQPLPLKGLQIGDAKFSDNNRIINTGDATSKDVERLMKIAKIANKIIPGGRDLKTEYQIWKDDN
ncbi:FAD-binding protein [Halalkalicoccus jeotgali]|uniref:UDP-N-acetylenolpyruvoylglucosamine reductase n=1 Tax=Halalkalicoccus jeotgali (strain DSM 18796 / CECT 7217 / JCM 14584 / KCTC 4019 / B3) TaxID=795797 RepID=D8J6R9_HALJB|nr:FAD-binding protein [Halalkalicoccus jeotgali]ADJ13946.1 UDP-N-acetylenolpyruvoylglucosamine reductase [Halalkalicoccus jeotgali B3]ELY34010.1 UDP-N-acetylenolpyruvoylglucosamine reductase [Halalkalicoccus jeotgali B3]